MKRIAIVASLALAGVVGGVPDMAPRHALGQQAFYRFQYSFAVYSAENELIHDETVGVVASNGAEAEQIAGQVGNNLLLKWAPGQQGAYCRRQLLRVE